MLLAASRLMRRKEASGAEVVCTLLAPNDRIWNTTLAALHLHKATILPKELILSSVLKMLAETPPIREPASSAAQTSSTSTSQDSPELPAVPPCL